MLISPSAKRLESDLYIFGFQAVKAENRRSASA